MAKVKFGKPKEKIKVANRDQGLRANNRVKVKGNKPGTKSISASLEELQRLDEGGSSYPMFGESRFSGLAREPKSAPKKMKKKKRKTFSFSSEEGGAEDFDGFTNGPPPPPPGPRRSRGGGGGGGFVPTAAPMVHSDEESDFSDMMSDDFPSDFDEEDDFSEGEESIFTSSSIGSRPHVPLDDSMSIISGEAPGSGKKSKADNNMFRGMSKAEAEEAEKNDLLARFHFLKQRGVHLSKNFTPKSGLNEMRMEMGRIEHEQQMARAVTINRRWFLTGASLLSKATDRYGPNLTKGRWHGFDKYVLNSIQDYDEPFERLSEHYGGVVSALTGGNPLWEIIVLFGYQFIMYGFVSGGADQARANEVMSSEEIKRRYPNLIQEAVEVELNRRQREEEDSLRRAQFEQRAQYAQFDQQQNQARAAAPPPVNAIRPPSVDFSRFYEEIPETSAPPPPPPPPPVLNSEGQRAFHEPQPMAGEIQQPQQQQQQQQYNIQPPTLPAEDPYMFDQMHAALNQIDVGQEQQQQNDGGEIEYETKGEILDNFDTPVATREGRPKALNKAPPNKRDLVEGNSAAEDDGKFVINIK
jgi:hypothetical protein